MRRVVSVTFPVWERVACTPARLVELGYTAAADLDGGFQAWAGLPVRRAQRRPRLRAAS